MASPVVIGLLLAVVTFVIYKFFFAPIFPADHTFLKIPGPTNRKLGTYIGDPVLLPVTKQYSHLHKMLLQYGPLMRRRVLTRNVLVVGDGDVAQEVLKDKERFPDRGHNGIVASLPRGLLGLPTGPEWARHRRAISPLFADRYMRLYSKIFIDKTAVLVDLLQKRVAESPSGTHDTVNIMEYISKLALDSIGLGAFGYDFASLGSTNSQYMDATHKLLVILIARTIIPDWLIRIFYAREWTEFFDGLNVFNRVADKMIDENDTTTEQDANTCLELLHAQKFSREDIRQELVTLILAGHETTAHTLGWALYMLGKSPESLAKAHEEIDRIFDEGFTMDQIFERRNDFEYVNAIFNEALRLYPTVPIIPRQSEFDQEICDGKYTVPANTNIFVSLYSVGRNPAVWEDADTFLPDRFYKTDAHKNPAFLPFGSGPRVCVGRRFAYLEAVTLLVGLLRHFSIETPADFVPDDHAHMTLGSVNGITLKVTPRL